MKQENQNTDKKPYQSPQVVEYGDIRELTLGGSMYIMWDHWMYKFFAT